MMTLSSPRAYRAGDKAEEQAGEVGEQGMERDRA
jgi:hypothetical protein